MIHVNKSNEKQNKKYTSYTGAISPGVLSSLLLSEVQSSHWSLTKHPFLYAYYIF